MTSVSRFLKQIPTDTPFFTLLAAIDASGSPYTEYSLNVFSQDGNASTTSYGSGKASGSFSQSTISLLDASGEQRYLFRDMGRKIMSSGRTFRRVQLLGTAATQEFSSNGAWQVSDGGVTGSSSASPATSDNTYNCFYFETGANGQGTLGVPASGLSQGGVAAGGRKGRLVRYG